MIGVFHPYLDALVLVIHNENIDQGDVYMGYHTPIIQDKTETLTNDLFSLDEPWRSRFLRLVANQATGWTWNERLPTQSEVISWLGDWDLYKRIKMQLNVWRGTQL